MIYTQQTYTLFDASKITVFATESGVKRALVDLKNVLQDTQAKLFLSRKVLTEQNCVMALKLPKDQAIKAKSIIRPEAANLVSALDGMSVAYIQPVLYKAASDFLEAANQ